MELSILDNKGKQSKKVKFDVALFPKKKNNAILHEVVVAHMANQRQGTHSTKTRREVSGGGVKPWRQKGTGRARAGSIRSPLWRHGGIIFGPKPRRYRQELPKKKKRLAFGMAVQELMNTGVIQVVEPIEIKEAKTKHVASVFKKWKVPTGSLYVVDKLNPDFVRASRNIENVTVVDVATLNTYDCLRARRLYITPDALTVLKERLVKGAKT